VIELPGGQTLLYDAGQLGPPETGARRIAGVLWSRGITRLDGVIISHADVDHFNALPELLEQFDVGTCYVSPVVFDGDTASLGALRAALEAHDVPLVELSFHDQLRVGDDCRIRVLHPPPLGVMGSDNANSLVLSLEYAGRRILLTGDLESPGLEDVLDEEPLDCDVILAPHHGSAYSNGFAEWSNPEHVVISGGMARNPDSVVEAFSTAGATVHHTARHGAITVTVDPEDLAISRFVP
jgi:competence protein ComEC